MLLLLSCPSSLLLLTSHDAIWLPFSTLADDADAAVTCPRVYVRVQAVDKHGITALLAAVWEGHRDCVKLLIDSGAAKDGKTPDGKSYREVAEKPEILEMLN